MFVINTDLRIAAVGVKGLCVQCVETGTRAGSAQIKLENIELPYGFYFVCIFFENKIPIGYCR